ncbi:hypothetical protein BpHYR1_050567 [Brachionus plicatilis]|uniref:Uncharacterized protein n=1 Tax=Brachionus plicatilis TaxID=10195 RepID=A0A3M7PAN4_BRAPC|nr:hypothetical protein BpHYR1_050567 [Brachionus plicatilis]
MSIKCINCHLYSLKPTLLPASTQSYLLKQQMPHTNQMFEPIAATRSLLKRDRKKKNLIPEIQNLSENEPLKELHQNEIKLPNIPVVRKLRGDFEIILTEKIALNLKLEKKDKFLNKMKMLYFKLQNGIVRHILYD